MLAIIAISILAMNATVI